MYLLNAPALKSQRNLRHWGHATLVAMKEKTQQTLNAWLAHPGTTAGSLGEYTESIKSTPEKLVKQGVAIASNPNCPVSALQHLSKVEDIDVLTLVAQHPNTPVAILAEFVKQGKSALYPALVSNPNTPIAALRLLAIKAPQSDVVPMMVTCRKFDDSDVDLLLGFNREAIAKTIASHQPLTEKQFATLWKQGHVESLLKNPNIDMQWVAPVALELPLSLQMTLVTNPAVSVEVLKVLSKVSDYELKKAVASHPNTPDVLVETLAKESRGNVAMGVACNPHTPTSVLRDLSRRSAVHIREAVARHVKTDIETLSTLASDDEKDVRAAVAANPSTPQETLRALSCDPVFTVNDAVTKNPSMGVITSLEAHESVLRSSGYGAFLFHELMSPKKVTRLLINSKHPQEVEYIFGSGHSDALQGLSALQSAFTNRKGKLDRDGYLSLLTLINEQVLGKRRTGVGVDNITLSLVLKHYDPQLVADIVTQYDPDEAKDCLRMLSSIVDFENKDTIREFKGQVERWLSVRRTSGSLHNYLVKLTVEQLPRSDRPFFQSRMKESVAECNALLDTGWQVNLPINSQELLAIGDAQRHCVGTQFYADRCMDGACIIFQIMPTGDMRRGYTFQFSREGRLLQAKGFANSAVPGHHIASAKAVFRKMQADVSARLAA